MSLKEEINKGLEVLKDELNSAIEIFEYYNLPEHLQKRIIENGVSYDHFGNGRSSCYLSAIEFSNILIYCKENNIELDNLDKIIGVLFYHWSHDENGDFLDVRVYKQLSRIIDQMDSEEKEEPKETGLVLRLIRPRY